MGHPGMWEETFLAMSALLGESIDDAVSALTPESAERVALLKARLSHPDKGTRANEIAHALKPVLRDLTRARLR